MKNFFRFLFILLFYFLSNAYSKNTQFGIQAGFGEIYTISKASSLTLYLGAYYSYDKNQFNFRIIDSSEDFFSMCCPDQRPTEYFTEYDVQYGKKIVYTQYFDMVVLGGLSYLYGLRRGKLLKKYYAHPGEECGDYSEYEKVNYTTVGIPIDIQFNLKYYLLGIGIHLISNINPENSYYGFLFSFQLGKLFKHNPRTNLEK